MIEKLTPENEAALNEYYNTWVQRSSDTNPFSYDEALEIVNKVQKHLLKRKHTPIVILDNPFECWVACHLSLNGKVGIKDLHKETKRYFTEGNPDKIKVEPFNLPYLCGSLDGYIFGFYDYFKDELKCPFGDVSDNYKIWHDTHKIGMIFPLEDVCIVSQKPKFIKTTMFNGRHVLSCDNGSPFYYEGFGDFKFYALNGTLVPQWLAETHSAAIPLERYGELSSVDQKSEFLRKVGIERMLEKGTLIDDYTKYPGEPFWDSSEYELWDMKSIFENVPYAPHLKMVNPTTKVYHVEGVDPSCVNLRQALEFKYGKKNFQIIGIA